MCSIYRKQNTEEIFRYTAFGIGIGIGSVPKIRYRYQKSTAGSTEIPKYRNAFGTDSSALQGLVRGEFCEFL